MEEFDEDALNKLAKLCRIECTEEEKKALRPQIAKVLAFVSQLDEVNTDGVKPCYRPSEALMNVMREDTVSELFPTEVFLANAPAHVGGMIRVPPIIKSINQP